MLTRSLFLFLFLILNTLAAAKLDYSYHLILHIPSGSTHLLGERDSTDHGISVRMRAYSVPATDEWASEASEVVIGLNGYNLHHQFSLDEISSSLPFSRAIPWIVGDETVHLGRMTTLLNWENWGLPIERRGHYRGVTWNRSGTGSVTMRGEPLSGILLLKRLLQDFGMHANNIELESHLQKGFASVHIKDPHCVTVKSEDLLTLQVENHLLVQQVTLSIVQELKPVP